MKVTATLLPQKEMRKNIWQKNQSKLTVAHKNKKNWIKDKNLGMEKTTYWLMLCPY